MGSGQTSDQAYNRQRTLYKQADKSAVTEELVEREAAREETVEETQNDEEITAEERKAEDSTEEEYEESYESEIESVFCEGFDSSFKAYMDYRCITDTSSVQYEMQQQAYTDGRGFRKIGDDYCVALGTGFTSGCRRKIYYLS